MSVQLAGTGVTLVSVSVSLRSSAGALLWSGESLFGIGVSYSSSPTGGSTVPPPTGQVMSLQFNHSSNSGYLALFAGTV